MNGGRHGRLWKWLCPWAMLGIAVVLLTLLGLSIWTAVLVGVLLVCPAMVVWGAIQVKRKRMRL